MSYAAAFVDKSGAGSIDSTSITDSTIKVPRIRILLAPYMSPFVVPLNKVQTWENLIVMLQRLFGPTFCSIDNPPSISHPDGRTIAREGWYEMVEEDVSIVVHTTAADPPPRPTPTFEAELSWLQSPIRDQTPLPLNNILAQQKKPAEKAITSTPKPEKVLRKEKPAKKEKGIWGSVMSVFTTTKPDPERIQHVANLARPQRKHKKKAPSSNATPIRDRREEKRKRRSITEAPHRPTPLKLKHSNLQRPPVIPKRPELSVGVQANYRCLDEPTVRAAVLKHKRASDELTLVAKPSTEVLKSSKPRQSSSSTLVDRPGTAQSCFKREPKQHDNKPLPKLPYTLSLFPSTPTLPTHTPLITKGNVMHLPPIASFEDLVKNTQSFSDAGNEWGGVKQSASGAISGGGKHKTTASKSSLFGGRRKESVATKDGDRKEWFRRPQTREGLPPSAIAA